jgi:ferredoxin
MDRKDMNKKSEKEAIRHRDYDVPRQNVKLRRPNYGKAITDSLPTIRIDPMVLDMASEILPLAELIRPMNKFYLTVKIELPKWIRRRKLVAYGWGMTRYLLYMKYIQPLFMNSAGRIKQKDLSQLKEEIRQYAGRLGYICGFTRIDRRFIADAHDHAFPFDTAIVLGMEMDKELLDEAPHPGDRLCDFEVYVRSGKKVFELARFIRRQGYRCFARIPFDGKVKYPPHAINAGLGELGANGVVITPEFGPRLRWCMISIDADLEPDTPRDFHMAAYCDACRRCIRACPGGAIPEERFWWRGVLKRKINDTRCYPYFVEYEGCGLCMKVCPINRFGYQACMDAFNRDGSILPHKEKMGHSPVKSAPAQTVPAPIKDAP